MVIPDKILSCLQLFIDKFNWNPLPVPLLGYSSFCTEKFRLQALGSPTRSVAFTARRNKRTQRPSSNLWKTISWFPVFSSRIKGEFFYSHAIGQQAEKNNKSGLNNDQIPKVTFIHDQAEKQPYPNAILLSRVPNKWSFQISRQKFSG